VSDSTSPVDQLPPGRATALIGWTFVGSLLALAMILILPRAQEISWQQAEGTILFHGKWVYDRIVHDPTHIDVAIVGTSRLEAGVSPVILAQSLDQPGRPTLVANLSLVQTGRDLHYEIIKLLLEHHPETKIVVLSLDGDTAASHPLFKSVAPLQDVLDAPVVFNPDYFVNLFYQPFGHLVQFAETLVPGIFSLHKSFDTAVYAGPNLDRTVGYHTPDGGLVNGNQRAEPSVLRQTAIDLINAHASVFRFARRLPLDRRLAIDRSYVRKIAQLAASKRVKLAFLRMPLYGPQENVSDLPFYLKFGPVFYPEWLSGNPNLYANGGHLNRSGAIANSRWLASQLEPFIGDVRQSSAQAIF
jgi:hypothetical protein